MVFRIQHATAAAVLKIPVDSKIKIEALVCIMSFRCFGASRCATFDVYAMKIAFHLRVEVIKKSGA